MDPKYNVGQQVIIAPPGSQALSPRGAELESCVGQVGQITDFHWISTDLGRNIFYLYTVQTTSEERPVVLHEDELKAAV